MKVQNWPTSQPIPYVRNPRKNDGAVAKVKASIQEFGFQQPIVVDKEGVIIVGHTRHQAALALGLPKVPVVVADNLTSSQAKAYRLADNRTNEEATWADNLLALELDELKLSEFDLALTGFSDEELSAYCALAEATQSGLTVDDACPEPPLQPKSRLGDVWILGNHRLMCGDSTTVADVERLMAGEKADMVWTDPPYNIAYEGGSKKREMIKNDLVDDFYQFLLDAYTVAYGVMTPGAAIYVTHADTERVNFTKAFVDAGFHLSSVIIWAKNNSTFGRQDYFWKHEPMLYGWHSGGAHQWHGPNTEDTVWCIDRPSRSEEHPTMKPIPLIERALSNSSTAGQVVLDLFGGSGSTLVACEKTARFARLMELDPKYCDVIVKRWQDFTGKQAVHADGALFDKRN